MKILISVALWGKQYIEIFHDFSIASLLSENNLPELSERNDVHFHILTTSTDALFLKSLPLFRTLGDYCVIHLDLMEEHEINVNSIPRDLEPDKYTFLSTLQNIAIKKSLEFDAVSFNYADFVWADGSLVYCFEQIQSGVDAVMSFCLPVDETKGKQALLDFKEPNNVISLPARRGAKLAIECLHKEATLRFWDKEPFTTVPTYILWEVKQAGIVIRAYHQTILAMRVDPDNKDYVNGITFGSLDGYFSSIQAKSENLHFAKNSDDALVFSLYETTHKTDIGGPSRLSWDNYGKEDSLRDCLRSAVSQEQRSFALEAIEVKFSNCNVSEWDKVKIKSKELLNSFHAETPFDAELFSMQNNYITSIDDEALNYKIANNPIEYIFIEIRKRKNKLAHRVRRTPSESLFAFISKMIKKVARKIIIFLYQVFLMKARHKLRKSKFHHLFLSFIKRML